MIVSSLPLHSYPLARHRSLSHAAATVRAFQPPNILPNHPLPFYYSPIHSFIIHSFTWKILCTYYVLNTQVGIQWKQTETPGAYVLVGAEAIDQSTLSKKHVNPWLFGSFLPWSLSSKNERCPMPLYSHVYIRLLPHWRPATHAHLVVFLRVLSKRHLFRNCLG